MLTAADIKEEEGEVESVEELKMMIEKDSGNQWKTFKKRVSNTKCLHCDHIAKTPRNLKMHIDAVHKGLVFMCDQCAYSSPHKSNLYNHQKAKHEMRVFKCLLCDVTTSFKQYLQKHMKEKHDGKIVFFCSDCDFSSDNKHEYMVHRKTDHYSSKKIKQNSSFRIPSDISPSVTEYSSVNSIEEVTQVQVYVTEPKLESSCKKFPCESCDYSTDRKHNLSLHNKAMHETKEDFLCEACPFSTTTKAYLQRHLHLMHKDRASKRNYPLSTPISDLPDHKFINSPGYRLPRLYIGGYVLIMNKFFLNEKDEKCGYFYCGNKAKHRCKVSAKASVGENEMMATSKKDETVDPLVELELKTESSAHEEKYPEMTLMSYQGIHTDKCRQSSPELVSSKKSRKSDLKCDLCEYVASTVQRLEQHREVKHDKITYSCNQCDFEVKYKASLRRHVQAKHEGIFFYCTLCDHKATTASHLKTHVEGQHEGITYDCDICGKMFKQKGHLKIHDDSMHKGVTYSCTHCSYISRQKGHLNHHIKTVHLGQPHKCEICGMIYAHNGQLKRHMLRDHNDKGIQPKFMCDICNFFTVKEIYLCRHIERKHTNKSKCPRRKSKRKSTIKRQINFCPIEENIFVELTEMKPIIEELVVEETKLLKDEEISLDENFLAETKFSAEMNCTDAHGNRI